MELESIAQFAAANYNLVSRDFVLSVGWTDNHIASRVDSGLWQAVHPGVYLIGFSPLGWHGRLRAATLAAGPLALVSHRSAAQLWGLEGIDFAPIELTVPLPHRPVPDGIVVHRTRRRMEPAVVAGIPVTSPERAVLDSAWFVPYPMVEQIYDSGIRKRIITADSMAECLIEFGTKGVRGRSKVIRVLDERREGNPLGSPAETIILRHLRMAGVEEPERQYIVRCAGGRVFILDLAWPRRWKAVEIDGLATHASASALTADLERQNLIMDVGWQLRRFAARQVVQHPRAVVAEIQAFLAA